MSKDAAPSYEGTDRTVLPQNIVNRPPVGGGNTTNLGLSKQFSLAEQGAQNSQSWSAALSDSDESRGGSFSDPYGSRDSLKRDGTYSYPQTGQQRDELVSGTVLQSINI